MRKLVRVLIPLAVVAACIVFLSMRISFGQKGQHSGEDGPQRKNVDVLEREVRQGLPVGSPLGKVEDFLAKRNIEFSYDESSRSVYAVARKLQGSTSMVSKSLQFHFLFDDQSQLESISCKVLYTGP